MAIPASAVWECRGVVLNGSPGPGVAADAGGGGWAPVTVSTFSGSDLVVDGSLNTKVTSASHNFVAADVGGRIQITNAAPTAWTPGFYTINSVASNAATLSASPAAVGTASGSWALVGQDRSQQNTVQVAIDNSVITTSIAANVITFTGYTPTVADVGNGVHMLTGTNVTAGWYFITAFTGSTWTVAGAAALPTSGTTTNATGNMGGALLTLGALSGTNAMVASNKAYCTGAFTSTGSNTFAQGAGNTVAPTRLIGYGLTRTDNIPATLTLTTNTGLTGISMTGTHASVENFAVDCGSLGTSIGISVGQTGQVFNCKVSNFTTSGISSTSTAVNVANCEVTAGTAAATAAINLANAGQIVTRCYVHDNACPGIRFTNGAVQHNLVANNSGAGSDGIVLIAAGSQLLNNTCHNNGRDGIRFSSASFNGTVVRNNLLTNNGGFGMTLTSGTALPASFEYDGNAYGGGASANTSGTVAGTTGAAGYSVAGIYGVNPYVPAFDVQLSVSPYVGPTSGGTANFALNNTAGGGAACRAASTPGAFPGLATTTGYLDMGAVQTRGSNTSPSAGGSPGIIMATG